MGLKTQTDAAEKIHNSTFPGEDVDRPAQVGSVAGVKRDCVSPSAPTRQGHGCVLPEATASLRLVTPARPEIEVQRSQLSRLAGWVAASHTHKTALGFRTDTSAKDPSCGQGASSAIAA